MDSARNPRHVFAVLRCVYLWSKKLYQTCKSFTGSALTSEFAQRRPYYLLDTGATVNTEPETAHAPPSVFCHFQKQSPQWLGKECHLNRANVFQTDINSAWPLRGGPSSDHAVLTTAMYSVRASARSELVHTAHSGGCFVICTSWTNLTCFLSSYSFNV